MTKALKILTSLLASDKGRKLLKKIILFIVSPTIALIMILAAFGKGFSNHNQYVMNYLFNNPIYSSNLPPELLASLEPIKSYFIEIEKEVSNLANLKKPLDIAYIKSILLTLIIDNDVDIKNSNLNISEYLSCFYEEDNNENTILVPITNTNLILENVSKFFNVDMSLKKEMINELYIVGLTGRNQELDSYVSLDTLLKDYYETSLNSELIDDIFTSPFEDDWKPYVTSEFGYRDPITLPDGSVTSSFHTGIDLARPLSTPVLSINSGTVVIVRYTSVGLGFYLVIDHGGGIFSVYGHLSRIYVYENETVNKGQIIGEVGKTGASTGSHLHLEIIENKQSVNPRKYLK